MEAKNHQQANHMASSRSTIMSLLNDHNEDDDDDVVSYCYPTSSPQQQQHHLNHNHAMGFSKKRRRQEEEREEEEEEEEGGGGKLPSLHLPPLASSTTTTTSSSSTFSSGSPASSLQRQQQQEERRALELARRQIEDDRRRLDEDRRAFEEEKRAWRLSPKGEDEDANKSGTGGGGGGGGGKGEVGQKRLLGCPFVREGEFFAVKKPSPELAQAVAVVSLGSRPDKKLELPLAVGLTARHSVLPRKAVEELGCMLESQQDDDSTSKVDDLMVSLKVHTGVPVNIKVIEGSGSSEQDETYFIITEDDLALLECKAYEKQGAIHCNQQGF